MYINESGNVVNSGGYEILLNGNTVSATDLIVNNGSYDANLITFTIDGMALYVEEGMTWEEYVNSDYNTLGLEIRNHSDIYEIYYDQDPGYVVGNHEHNPIDYTDIISSSEQYIFIGLGWFV